jgi:hypothetical protein
MAIVVVIEEACRNRPAARCDASLRGYIGEGAVAVDVIQDIFSVAGYV